MANLPSPPKSMTSQHVSPRGRSSSQLQTAIHSPFDPGATLKRVNAVLRCHYDPTMGDQAAMAAVAEEFCQALAGRPQWAIERAFDNWQRSRSRRPTPGDICAEVGVILAPFTAELARRRKLAEAQAEFEEASTRDKPTAEMAQVICDRAGFTPQRVAEVTARPMASPAELAACADSPDRPTRYADRRDPDDVRISRLRNPVMRESMGLTAKQAEAEISAILDRKSQEDAA